MLLTRREYRPNRDSSASVSFACSRAINSSSLGERTEAPSGTATECPAFPVQTRGIARARPFAGELIGAVLKSCPERYGDPSAKACMIDDARPQLSPCFGQHTPAVN